MAGHHAFGPFAPFVTDAEHPVPQMLPPLLCCCLSHALSPTFDGADGMQHDDAVAQHHALGQARGGRGVVHVEAIIRAEGLQGQRRGQMVMALRCRCGTSEAHQEGRSK